MYKFEDTKQKRGSKLFDFVLIFPIFGILISFKIRYEDSLSDRGRIENRHGIGQFRIGSKNLYLR